MGESRRNQSSSASKPVEATPWAFSKIKDFETCPLQYYHKRVLKEFPFVETPQIIYGNRFHKAAELYVNDDEPIEKEFEFARPLIDGLLEFGEYSIAEIKCGLTDDSVPTGFFAKDVWSRAVIDLLVVNRDKKIAWIVDWKTGGNPKYADKGQLEVCALHVFRKYPEVEEVRAGLAFVLENKFPKWSFKKSEFADIWRKWKRKVERLEAAHKSDVWNPSPSGLCKKHCPVLSCAHNGLSQ